MPTHIALTLATESATVLGAKNFYAQCRKDKKINFSFAKDGVQHICFFAPDKTIFSIRPYFQQELKALIIRCPLVLKGYNFPVHPIKNLFAGDLLYAEGGIFTREKLHSAVFLPYFAPGAYGPKRTYVFANLMSHRFKIMSTDMMQSFNLDISLTSADYANWVFLHEAFHNSGPLPLFTDKINKFGNKPYGFIEELRVELSIIYYILNCIPKETVLKKVVWLIILDRIFRAARFHYNATHMPEHNMYAKMVEGDAAICILALLDNSGLINLKQNSLELDFLRLSELAAEVLEDIFAFEQAVKSGDDFISLSQGFCDKLRQKHFALSEQALAYLRKHAQTNCTYKLDFKTQC
jgi:hypothetical protein